VRVFYWLEFGMIPTFYDATIEAASTEFMPGRDWRALKAQYWQESRFKPGALSTAGARGIAQFMPATWQDMIRELGMPDDADPHHPLLSIRAGAYYMAKMLSGWTAKRSDEDRYCLALASYNVGFGNMLKAQKIAGQRAGHTVNDYAGIIAVLPDVPHVNADETTDYVIKITGYYKRLVTTQFIDDLDIKP
jgi:soluble lytic murein transglycosylase-like protein